MKRSFIVTLEVPSGVTLEEMKEYIKNEVKCNVGSRSPEDPIFYLDKNSVTVKTVAKKKKKTEYVVD